MRAGEEPQEGGARANPLPDMSGEEGENGTEEEEPGRRVWLGFDFSTQQVQI